MTELFIKSSGCSLSGNGGGQPDTCGIMVYVWSGSGHNGRLAVEKTGFEPARDQTSTSLHKRDLPWSMKEIFRLTQSQAGLPHHICGGNWGKSVVLNRYGVAHWCTME